LDPSSRHAPQNAMVRRKASILAAVAALAVVAGVLHFANAEPVVVFAVAAAALGGLAWAISIATESVGERFGPAVTGALQSTLGNLPELFIVLFALSAGELVVARTSILGSLFANGLLVLGLAIVAGSRAASDGTMRFRPRLPQDTATLLLLAIGIIVLLGLSHQVGDRASGHETAISVVGAIVLLAVYGLWVWNYLRSDTPAEEAHAEPARSALPFGPALVVLAVAGVAAALVSDWFIEALDPAVEALGISKAFTGLVIVAIAGNAVENVVGVSLAAKGKSDLSISVVKNSVAQIAAFLFPALVLLSLAFTTHLTFVLSPIFIGALVITALAMWQITGDGEALLFEGAALVGLYVILATLMWFE
jgi:Ca2+:H+ antiporter